MIEPFGNSKGVRSDRAINYDIDDQIDRGLIMYFTARQRQSYRPPMVIADDHELVARGLASLLAHYYSILGIVHSGAELLTLLRAEAAGCVLLDLSMPGQSGLDVLPILKREWPMMKVIIVTMHLDRVLVDATMSLGADGFVPKDAGLPELLDALRSVLAGNQFISPMIPKHTERTSMRAQHLALASLTP